MYFIRPIAEKDLDDLFHLATESAFGLTSLIKNRDALAKKIHHVARSFELLDEKPQGQSYLFVLEDAATGRILGTTAVESKVGGFQPFYSFRVENMVLRSESLKRVRELRVLHLKAEHDGPSSIGTLYLTPEARHSGVGRFLSLVRFAFMATFPESFEKRVLAEMRGVSDRDGRSPFWEAVGRHFFDIDFPYADYLSVVDKKFIAELMPEFPIYADLLPEGAKNVLGKVHPQTEPALKILYSEGFSYMGNVDIFDAGPLVIADVAKLRTVRAARVLPLREIAPVEIHGDDPPRFIVTNENKNFRGVLTDLNVLENADGIRLAPEAVDRLGVAIGDPVRFVTLR